MARNRLPWVHRRRRRDGTYGYRGWACIDGARVFTETTDTERAAYEAALRLRDGRIGPGVTLAAAAAIVAQEAAETRTEATSRWYRGHLDAVMAKIPGETYLHDIIPAMLEEFVRARLAEEVKGTGRRVKPATVNADLRALHRLFAVAIRRGWVDANPVRLVNRPREDRPAMDWFTDDEFRKLLDRVTDDAARDLFALFAMTGIRRSEAARLEPAHVRPAHGQIVVPGKTGTRVVPVADDLRPVLQRVVARGLPALADIDRTFRHWARELGEPRLHPHALRHTFGTALVRSGVAIDVVQRLMGHAAISTTLRYVHEAGADAARAVGALRLLPPSGGRSGQGAGGG